ncbi:MAG: hypothetical protein ACLTDR_00945 [Adlercreutzia equolifaciens]
MEFSFGLIGFLIVFPLIVAAALLFVRQEGPRRVIVCVSGVVIALASVVLVVSEPGGELHALRVRERGHRLHLHGHLRGHRGGHRVVRRALQEPVGRRARGRAGGRHAHPRVHVLPRHRGALRPVLRLALAADDLHHRRGGKRHLHLRLGLHGGFPGPRAGRGA